MKPPPPRKPGVAPRVRALDELPQLVAALQAQRAADAARRQREAAERARREAAAHLFRQAVADVTPLPEAGRVAPERLGRAQPPPHARQRERDEQAVLREALSDDFDPVTLLDTDSELGYLRQGVAPDTLRRLRRGTWTVQADLDLHGLRREDARAALAEFVAEAARRGLRCLRVVHGKGLGSAGRQPVLKGKVRAWLAQKQEVIAFCTAPPAQGGAGALLVLLRAQRGRLL